MSKKRKVGIITLHQITNYGGILQAYALQTVVERLGFEVEIIEKKMYPRLRWWEPLLKYPYRMAKRIILKSKAPIRSEKHIRDRVLSQWYEAAFYTNLFINSHIHRRYVFDYSEVKRGDYFALIVGSDQIWRPKYLNNERIPIRDAFLGFAKDWDIRRIAYAASFGTEEWEYSPSDTEVCKQLLKCFDVVTCRETSGVILCRDFLDYEKASCVLDPTLLLSQQDYISLLSENTTPSEGDLFCYILDRNENSSKVVSFVSEQTGYHPFEVLAKSYLASSSFEDKVQPPVEKWLRAFVDSKFVVTDSFHACVFSIIFKKPFIAIINERRGRARYKTLLKMFDLDYRLIDGFDCSKISEILSMPFVVNDIIWETKRDNSLSILKQNLKITK